VDRRDCLIGFRWLIFDERRIPPRSMYVSIDMLVDRLPVGSAAIRYAIDLLVISFYVSRGLRSDSRLRRMARQRHNRRLPAVR